MKLVYILPLATLFILFVAAALFWRWPRRLNKEHYQQQWKELQKLLGDRQTWPDAVIQGDKLLDTVLKKRRFRGKSMGERLVSAQHSFSNNDDVWYAHKLRMALEQRPDLRLKKWEVKDALIGIGQALKDLGAL